MPLCASISPLSLSRANFVGSQAALHPYHAEPMVPDGFNYRHTNPHPRNPPHNLNSINLNKSKLEIPPSLVARPRSGFTCNGPTALSSSFFTINPLLLAALHCLHQRYISARPNAPPPPLSPRNFSPTNRCPSSFQFLDHRSFGSAIWRPPSTNGIVAAGARTCVISA